MDVTDSATAASGSASVVAATTVIKAPSDQPLTHRWLELETLSWAGRYRSSTNTNGRHLFQYGQDRYIADGKIRLDSQERYSINFHASSGRYFTWAFADEVGGDYREAAIASRPYRSPALSAAINGAIAADPDGAIYKRGLPTRGGYFYLRQLYFSATPIKEVTAEFGSLAIDHGQNSEITSFDDDGYISGERVSVRDSKHLYFDRIGATWAFLGSSLVPNFFARGGDLAHSNYQQYLVEKSFSQYVKASVDFTESRGTHTWREAASVKIPTAKVIDTVLVELYQRTNATTLGGVSYGSASGFAVSASKTMFKRLEFTGGYDSVDDGTVFTAVAPI